MLVREVIEGIENKTLLNKDLAEKHNVTGKTISNKIKKLGFKWISNEMRYSFEGENIEEVYNTEWDSLFTSGYRSPKQPKKNNTKPLTDNADKNTQTAEKPSKAQNKPDKSNDKIDMLLNAGTKKKNKTYRGFYFDDDVLNVINSVGAGNKSELINECLRVVFKSKGLL